MRVAVDRAADGPWRAGPFGDAREGVADREAHEPVDRHTGIGPHAIRRRPGDLAAVPAQDQAAHAPVAHQDVRAPAEARHGHAGLARQPQDRQRLVRAAHLGEDVGRAADAQRGEGRERRVPPHALGAQLPPQRVHQIHALDAIPSQRRPLPRRLPDEPGPA